MSKEDYVSLIASGYEWDCPECSQFNTETCIPDKVECTDCGKTFHVDMMDINHAFD